jgi:hypothetical protein
MTATLFTPRRIAYSGLALALLAACLVVQGPWWQAVAFGLAPDLPLLAGMSHGLERGQLHPRAVPLYNALHRFTGPVLVGVAFVLLGVSPLGPLAWALHIAFDRTVGYGLRASDGFQRS